MDDCDTEFVVEDEAAVREHVQDHFPFPVPDDLADSIAEDLLKLRALEAETSGVT